VQETEFSESERSRDPFRSFAKNFAQDTKARVHSQREVILSQYALDELKLIGIVTRAEPAKAMLVDPTGKGFVVQRGQFVGRADVVQGAGASGAVYEINWRVDRIRPSDVVLIREDPANPDVPSATRVIPLRPEDEANAGGEIKK
jgi:type IV pilus assembly protein PilP